MTEHSEYGLKSDVLDMIRCVFSNCDRIEKAILYGSRAKYTFKNGSDIDITLIGEKLDLRDLNSIHNRLDDLFLPYTFDLSVFDRITNEELISHIERVGKILYEKNAVAS